MTIRPLQEQDIPALAALAAKTYAETFGHSMTREQLEAQVRETRSEACFRSAIQTDTILVALVEQQLAGYLQLGSIQGGVRGGFRGGVRGHIQGVQPGPRDLAVHAVYIHADHQGQGLGRALMDAAFDHPRCQQAENVFIDVWEENKRALNFYVNYGFKIVGARDVTANGEVIGEDLVLMRPARMSQAE